MADPAEFEDAWETLGGPALEETWQRDSTLGSPAGRSGTLPNLPTLRLTGDAADLALGRPLGQGAMGTVLEAEQVALGRTVAVKCLNEGQEDHAAVLVREARLAGRLEHPNIVPVHTIGTDPAGGPLVVMKRIEGESWRAVLRDPAHALGAVFGPDPLERNLRILAQVCRALHFAHERGVLHRDLKPENVMLGRHGEVYVVDWGLAVERAGAVTEALAGTPGYFAPEMVRTGTPLDARTDVYLLGAILHEILVGDRRHRGTTLRALCVAAWMSEPYAYPKTTPRALGGAANRACARDPEARFPSADALRRAIEDYLTHRQVHSLTARARATLDALPYVPEDEVEEAFGACRFGFEEALRLWPEDADAREGLQRALTWMIQRDLARREPGAAARLLRALPERDPALAAQVDAEQARIADVLDARDARLGRGGRIALHLGLATALGVLPIVAGALRNAGVLPPPVEPAQRALAPLIAVAILGLAIRLRPSIAASGYNRRLVGGLFVILVAASASWALTALADAHFAHAAALVMLNTSVVSGCMGMLHDRRFWPLAPLYLIAAFVVAVSGHAEASIGVANLLALAWLYRAWSSDRSMPSLSIRR